MVKKVSFWLLVALVVVVVVSAGWGIPLKIAFSGRLTDSSGKVITKVNDVTFKLFDSESGGTQLGSAITLSGPRNLPNGIINTTLDVPSNVFQTNDNVWLEVSFTPDGGNLTTLSRQQIVSVPFAYRAEEADKVGGMTTREVINAATSEALAQVPAGLWAKTGDNISNTNTGNVGIGMTRPIAKLHLQVSGTDAYAGLGITSSLDEGKTITINQGTAGKLNFTEPKVIDLMTLDFNTGNVGIGTTSPTHKLDVNGSATIGNQDSPFMVKTFSSVYVPKGGSAQISIGENKTVYGISGFMKSASKSWPNNQWSFFTTNMDYDSSTGKITIYNNSTDSFNANIIVFYN